MLALHIVPVGDQIEHDLCEDCLCGPRLDVWPDLETGQYGFVYVHASLDGRELSE